MNEDTIFAAAIEKTSSEARAALLDVECAGNTELRARLEILLQAHDHPDPAFESPPPGLATAVEIAKVTETVGSTIGPYKLMEQIGEGGMGVVYVAEQKQPIRRKVALKIIKPGMDTKQVIARFEAERQALALMNHPNIAKVLDVGATETGQPYFTMELVRGLPITEYCDKKTLNTRERLELFIDVCRAVKHAHQKGIIHRDLKPSNILVTIMEDGPVPKEIDFGVAKATNQQLTEHTLYTTHLQIIGTPLYMSPEQAEMTGFDIDTRSDVYSLGVLLYELLTGTTPFEKEKLKEAGYDEMRRIIREDEPPKPSIRVSTLKAELLTTISGNRDIDPRKYSHTLKGELDWIVMKALVKDRNRRYESASAFADDIERFLIDEPIQACPPSTSYRLLKFARRNRTALGTTVLVLLSLIVGTVVSTWQAFKAIHAQHLLEQKSAALEQKSSEAETAVAVARQNAIYSKQLIYASEIRMAAQSWRDGDVRSFTDLLDRYDSQEANSDLRGFEWWYLRQFANAKYHTLVEGGDGICLVRYSPDGKYIVTGGHDGKIHLWDSQSERHLQEFSGHEGLVRGVDFSPDGDLLASIGDDGIIRIWNTTSRREIASFRACEGHGYKVFFALDGKILVSSGEGAEVTLWDFSTLKQVGRFDGFSMQRHRGVKKRLDCSPDRNFCIAGDANGDARVYDLRTRKLISRLEGLSSEEYPRCFRFSPDGKLVAGGTDEHTVFVWDTRSGKVQYQFKGHKDDIQDLAFYPDGTLLASSDKSGVIRTHHFELLTDGSSQLHHVSRRWPNYFRGHRERTWSLDFSPSGEQLVSASKDGSVRFWPAQQRSHSVINASIDYISTEFLSSEDELVIAAKNQLLIWNRTSGDVRRSQSFPHKVESLAFSANGRTVVTSHENGAVQLWDSSAEKVLKVIPAQAHSVDVSSDGTMIASASADDTATLWNTSSCEQIHVFESLHNCKVVCFSKDDRILATGAGNDIVLFDIKSGRIKQLLRGHQNTVECLAFTPDGRYLVSGSDDRTVRIWDIESGGLRHVIHAHHDKIGCLTISPDGRTVASGDNNGMVAFSHIETGRLLFDINLARNWKNYEKTIGQRWIRDIRFSSNGQDLVVAVRYSGVVVLSTPGRGGESRSRKPNIEIE